MKQETKVKIIDFVKKILRYKEPNCMLSPSINPNSIVVDGRKIYTFKHIEEVDNDIIEMYSFNSIFATEKKHAANKLAEYLIKNDFILFESESFYNKTIFRAKLDVVTPFKK